MKLMLSLHTLKFLLPFLFRRPYFINSVEIELSQKMKMSPSLVIRFPSDVEGSVSTTRGVHPPGAMMHFLPCFRISPYFQTFFRLCGIFSQFDLFPQNVPFSSAKISDEFESPQFSLNIKFPPNFGKVIIPPYFLKFPSDLEKFTVFLTYFMCFSFPLLL